MSAGIYRIAPDDDGIRLDRWFKRHRADVPHALLARWTRQGLVRLDGKKAGTGDRIAAGQRLDVPALDATASPAERPERQRPPVSPEDAAFAQGLVIHRDNDALALNKPPGLATQGGSRTHRHVDGLLDALCFERPERPKLVHRLDKDTSGVLLLARSARAAGHFSKAFSGRDTRKIYWALVVGHPHPDSGLIKAPIGKQAGSGGEKMTVDEKNGQTARTRYRVIERAGPRAAWVELQPLTGRTHQLRVHCAEVLKCPIVGDAKYGGPGAFLSGALSRKMHLHARSLTLPHPDGHLLSVQADPPEHMRDSFATLGFELARIDDFEPLGLAFDDAELIAAEQGATEGRASPRSRRPRATPQKPGKPRYDPRKPPPDPAGRHAARRGAARADRGKGRKGPGAKGQGK